MTDSGNSFLLKRFLEKVNKSSQEQLQQLIRTCREVFSKTKFEEEELKPQFLEILNTEDTLKKALFFGHVYQKKDWFLFCELFVYPYLLNAPYLSFWEFPLQEYLEVEKPTIPIDFTRVSIDVGMAFNAPNSSEWVKNPSMYVLGFEPNPTNLQYLHLPHDKITPPPNYPYDMPTYWLDSKYIGSQVQIFPFALSYDMGSTDFYCTTNDPGTSSMYKPLRFGVETKVTVKKRTLSSILAWFPWDRIPYLDHLKIDAQGHDFEILLGSLSYLDRIAYINVEMYALNQYEGVDNKFPFIHALLESQGFIAYNSEGGNCSYVNKNLLDYAKTFKPQFIDL
jgi:FkbM family methyltransferase